MKKMIAIFLVLMFSAIGASAQVATPASLESLQDIRMIYLPSKEVERMEDGLIYAYRGHCPRNGKCTGSLVLVEELAPVGYKFFAKEIFEGGVHGASVIVYFQKAK